MGVNLWVGALIAAFVSGLLGATIAWLDFITLAILTFALITLAFAEMAEIIVIGWEFLGGASGLFCPKTPAISRPFNLVVCQVPSG